MRRAFHIWFSWIIGLPLLGGCTLQGGVTKNGFDLSNASVPVAEIRSGGPPRDGIPAIDRPVFIPVSEARFLRDKDWVIGVSHGGVHRAYPVPILNWHEIVNDTIAGLPVAVTYCPLCGTGMVFDRRISGQVFSFGVSGLLYQSDVLMYDRETESLWSQLGMTAVSGRFNGVKLSWLPSDFMTWKAWRQKYPDGEVLSTKTGHVRDYGRNHYASYHRSLRTMFPVDTHRRELPQKEWVLGVIVEETPKAYKLSRLTADRTVTDNVAGVKIPIRFDAESRLATAERADNGARLPVVQAYWFAWQAFYPDTLLWATED